MFHHLHRSLFLFLIFFCFCDGHRADIYGIWYFDRFGGPHGEIAESPEIVRANKLNKGLIYNFAKDHKVIRIRPGEEKNDDTVNYQVLYSLRQVIVGSDTLRIMLLTSEISELYPKDESKAALFLKRSKDGKTSTSAP